MRGLRCRNDQRDGEFNRPSMYAALGIRKSGKKGFGTFDGTGPAGDVWAALEEKRRSAKGWRRNFWQGGMA